MRKAAQVLAGFGIAGLALATLAGLSAPIIAKADLINHFRAHIFLGLIVLCAVAAWLRARRLLYTAMSFALINFALAMPAFFFVAPAGDAATAPSLKIVTANVWGRNKNFAPLAAYLRAESADLVLLSEADQPIAPMLAELSDTYPYRIDCINRHYCRLALLSRFPLKNARALDRSDESPPHILTDVLVKGRSIAFAGIHLARPYSSRWQTREIDFVVATLAGVQGPLIVAGDLNATPWSWTMVSLQLRSRLERHKTLGATWPANIPPFPQLLIDHVLSRGGLRALDAHVGPNIGSDHLPMIVTLGL